MRVQCSGTKIVSDTGHLTLFLISACKNTKEIRKFRADQCNSNSSSNNDKDKYSIVVVRII